eukprot:CAMPEP_0117695622 /NCGR_PEP_ID=MMETSP0804-20121206/28237_1 /TAXON_ID=1074897 /ORGANISM="Tetraselmis astigmatica, Strain CCMP880" /LENGTH=264 /DNA_ID=CAMNT_0005509705 /DNA_START=241 /DNA_END=1035 /DNA_ORIENTATION=-
MAACASLALLIAAAWTPSGTHGAVRDRDSAFIGYSERSRSEAGNCKDEAPHCEDWATDGECDANPRFMKISCRKSCNTCGSDSRLPSSCTTCATLQLATAHGMIPILMRSDWSPKAVEAVLALLGGSSGQLRGPLVPPCKGCELYRSEKVPPPGVSDNFGGPGPPYALLQGRIPGLKPLNQEATPLVERGMVCLIGSGPDFFIAVGPHHEWGQAHTVWGEVVDMSTVDLIVETLPTKQQVWGQTHVAVLEPPLPFTAKLRDTLP